MPKSDFKRGVVRKGKYAPIHVTMMKAKLADGTTRLGLFASDDVAREQMADRRMTEGSRWKAEVKLERNSGFWRLVHKLGQWLIKHHESFADMDAHEAVKEVQRRSGIGCEITRSDIRDNDGKLIYRVKSVQPLSLAYDCMDESEFRLLWDGGASARGHGGWLGWMRKYLYPDMPTMGVDEIERLVIGRVIDWAEVNRAEQE